MQTTTNYFKKIFAGILLQLGAGWKWQRKKSKQNWQRKK